MRRLDALVHQFTASGHEVTLLESRSSEHLTELGRQFDPTSHDRLIIAGGDGTVNRVVRGLDLSGPPIGIIPLGSGNDFATVLGIPRQLGAACRMATGSGSVAVDVGLANGVRFVVAASVGFDAAVSRWASSRRRFPGGSLLYLAGVLRLLPRFQPLRLLITSGGRQLDQEVMFVVAANASRYGGGVRIAPEARIDDRLLDLVVVSSASRFTLLRALPLAYSGRHTRLPYVKVEKTDGVKISTVDGETIEIWADGEPLTTTPVTIGLEQARLRVAVG
jgi:diacylglycerol kinase (ATP)